MSTSHPSLRWGRVPPFLVPKIWPKAKDLIADSLKRSNSDFTADRIKEKIDRGDAQLWIIFNDKILAVGTTELATLENGRKLCVVSTLAGEDMALWDHLWEQFEQLAREQRCNGIQVVGRVGWFRYLRDRGFKQPWVVLEKAL